MTLNIYFLNEIDTEHRGWFALKDGVNVRDLEENVEIPRRAVITDGANKERRFQSILTKRDLL